MAQDTSEMEKSLPATVRKLIRQFWRDVVSIYYANTPTWRWLKSGALVFLGFFAWMAGSVLLSVEPSWGVLTYVMAYGFLLLVWGPFTHLAVVPLTIRLRRTANHPAARWFSKNSGKVNLTIFFSLVIVFGTITPSIMMLEFSPSFSGDEAADFSGELVCNTGEEVVTCHIENVDGVDTIEVRSGGQTLMTIDSEPYEFELQRSEIAETRSGKEFRVIFYDGDGTVLNRQVRLV